MFELKRFLNDFEFLSKRLGLRNIPIESLEKIRNDILLRNSLIQDINELRNKKKTKDSLNSNSQEERKKSILLKKQIFDKEENLKTLEETLYKSLSFLPNCPYQNVPDNSTGNVTVDEVSFVHNITNTLKGEEIIKKLQLIDEEKSVKISGSKFVVYKNFGSKLLRALINFMLSTNEKKGYQIFDIPYIANGSNHYNVGQLPKFKEDLYKIENSEFYLIPTSETVLVNFYKQQIIEEEQIPIKVCSYSPCFRAEAGSAGQENKGIIRLHQFNKVELVKIVKPENSYLELNQMLSDAQDILKLLKITHRVVNLCHEELGFAASQTFDIEV